METAEKRSAFINAQVACAMAEISAMQAANQQRPLLGESIAYGEDAFRAIEHEYMISHNAVIEYLRDV